MVVLRGNILSCLVGLYEKALPASLSWEERLMAARRAGYDFVEISIDETDEKLKRVQLSREDRHDILRAIINTGTPVLTMCLSGNRRYPIGSEDKAKREKGIELILKAIDFSIDVGIRIVQLAGYDNFYEASNKRTQDLFLDGLYKVTEYASSHAVMLSIENVDTDFMDSITKIMSYIKKVDSPWLTLYPDIGNLMAAGLSISRIEDDIKSNSKYITAFHVKDSLPNIIRRVPYGEGIVNFERFFSLLDGIGFEGLLVAEMWSDDSVRSEATARDAREFIRNRIIASQSSLLDLNSKEVSRVL